jgi:DNA-binding LacI/PurR family transcriptional regulator
VSTFGLDPRSGLGIAEQIRARIALQMADGELAPDDRLPPVRSLARELGVNVNTIRAAYAKLEADGLVQTRHGVGSVVVEAPAGASPGGSPAFGVNTIAVLIGGLDPFYLPLLRGIEEVASERGTLVLIADTRDSASLAGTITRRLVARGVDGIIAVSAGDSPDRPPGQGEAALPIVYVDQPDRRGYSLVFDAAGAGYTATRHLRQHGHDRVGLVTAPLTWPTVAEVHQGYLRAVEDADTDPATDLVSEVPEFTVEAGRVAMARLLALHDPPSAVFAGGWTLALGAMDEARSRGLHVPRDLAIVGYTDSPLAALVDPPLTMVEVPAHEIGLRAMRTLSDLIQGRRPRRRRTVLPTQLIVRDSCGSHPPGS